MNNHFPEQPKSIKLKQSDHLILIKKWFDWKTIKSTVYTCFWSLLSFGLFITQIPKIKEIKFPESPESIALISLMCLIWGSNIFFIYYTIAKWINQTYIYAYDDMIKVRHQPIPWKDNLNLRIEQLQNLYSKKESNPNHNDEKIYFEVRAKTNHGDDKKLIKVYQREEALFIQKTLKDYFHIEDEPIEGELSSEDLSKAIKLLRTYFDQ